jgi:hypothetical protein
MVRDGKNVSVPAHIFGPSIHNTGQKHVIAIQGLIVEAAHPATLQYTCTVLKLGGDVGFFMILITKAVQGGWARLLYHLAFSILQQTATVWGWYMRFKRNLLA